MRKSKITKDTDIKEYRRILITRLSEKTDLGQVEISEIVDCTQGYVSQVLSAYRGGGESELKSIKHPGAESRLKSSQLSELKSILDRGAKASGFNNDL